MLLGLFLKDCRVNMTRWEDNSNDSGINIDQIEESNLEEDELDNSYQEATQASQASKASQERNNNLSQNKSSSQKNTSQSQIVL